MEISSIPQSTDPAMDHIRNNVQHKQDLIPIRLANLPSCARFESTTPADKWFSYDLKPDFNKKDDKYVSILLDKNNLPDKLNFSAWFDNGDALYGHRYEYVFYLPSDKSLIREDLILKANSCYYESIAEETRRTSRDVY